MKRITIRRGTLYPTPPPSSKSCVGCKWLYARDSGYSNYTVENTTILCAKDMSVHLPADAPYDWEYSPNEAKDNWPCTNNSRCWLYAPGPMVHLDVDGETKAKDCTDDPEVIAAIDGD